MGRTQGYGRSVGEYHFHGEAKSVWVRPLHRRAQRQLSAAFDAPALQVWGGKAVAPALADINAMKLEGRGGLFARLRALPDVRKARGIRHELTSILAVAIGAVVCGARSFVAIGEWSAQLSPEMRRRLRCRRQPATGEYQAPSEATIRRTLQRMDAEALDRVLNAWVASRHPAGPGSGVAVDGKVLRGARGPDGQQVHVFAAILHGQGVVLAQRQIPDKTNEIPEFQPLLTPLDLEGKVVTADAMHAQVGHARFVVEQKRADYVFTVKENQPTLLQDIRDLDDGLFSPSGDAEEQGSRPH